AFAIDSGATIATIAAYPRSRASRRNPRTTLISHLLNVWSDRRLQGDLDPDVIATQDARGDGRPRRRATLGNPSLPDLVHCVEIPQITQPDVGEEHPRPIGAGQFKQTVDGPQDLAGLAADALGGVVRSLPAHERSPVMNENLTESL